MRFILGSQSPRRKEILSYLKIPFEQIPSHFDERSILFKEDPLSYVSSIAREKAHSLAEKHSDAIILTADTIVYRKNKIYQKPINREDAFNTLKELSGKWHSVYTGIAVWHKKKTFLDVEETKVLFNALKAEQIHRYHNTIHFLDKAGAYAIQETGCLICKKIEGCYYNVMGLPLNACRKVLAQIGLDIWKYIG